MHSPIAIVLVSLLTARPSACDIYTSTTIRDNQGVGIATITAFSSSIPFGHKDVEGTACVGDEYWIMRPPSLTALTRLHMDALGLRQCYELCMDVADSGGCSRRDYESCVLGYLTVRCEEE